MKKLIPLLGLLLTATQANAADIDAKQFYFGAGAGINSLNNNGAFNDSDAVGIQVFAGLPLAVDMGSAALAVEIGYMDSGNFDNGGSANGLWSTAVITAPLNNDLKLLGRVGFDIGDDDGLMVGAGIGFPMTDKIDIRIEYVIRDHIDSLQGNVVFRQ